MKISKRSLDALAPKDNGRYFVWDDNLSGFGVRVESSGRKTFVCRYRNRGVRRQFTLGRYGHVTPEESRKEAKKILGSVALGADPGSEKAAQRQAISFCDLFELFLKEHGPKLKPSSKAEYKRAILGHALPIIGRLPAEKITTKDLNKIHLSLVEHPYRANRVIAYLGSVFSWAMRSGYLPDSKNPTKSVQRFREQGRQRYLTNEELIRLGKALRDAETVGIPWKIVSTGEKSKHVPKSNQLITYPKHVTNAIRLLLLTGCRLREILHLRWEDVDMDRGLLFLPDSKTGQKTIILNLAASSILNQMEHTGIFVVPGDNPDNPRHDLKRPWTHIRTSAELDDVNLHDLRHTHASVGAASGFGLPIIGKLLGHASSATTQRYAHLSDDPARRASDVIGSTLQSVLNGQPANQEKSITPAASPQMSEQR